MSPIDSTGASTIARGSPHTGNSVFSARSGPQKAQMLQSLSTSAAAAPVETARSIAQSQTSTKSRMQHQAPTAEQIARKAAQTSANRPNPSLAKPMTAVLLHELRLQQELADVHSEISEKRG